MPVAIGAAIIATAAVTSQVIKSKAAGRAARKQREGIEAGKNDINDSYDTAQSYQDPYVDAGKQTIGDLVTGLKPGGDFNRNFTAADFQADPGYAFRREQGQLAVDQGAAARGGVLSGAALKAEQRFGQGLAAQEYQSAYQRFNNDINNRFNRLSTVARMGQGAANVSTQSEQSRGEDLANLDINKGNINAAKSIAQGNAAANANNAVGNAVASYFTGGMGGMGGGGGSQTISDYTGPKMQDWLKQGGGSTSYGN